MPDPAFDYWRLQPDGLDTKKKVGKKFDWVEVLPFAPVPEVVYLDEDKEPRGFKITFRFEDRKITATIPAAFIYAGGAAELLVRSGGPSLSGEQIRILIRFLTDVVAGRDQDPKVKREPVVTRAEWKGPVLNAPGSGAVAAWNTELAAYGACSPIDEDDARKFWQLALEQALHWPKEIVVMGMPIGSVYVRPLQLDNFALHITSESSQGKTESAEIAMSAFGEARKPRGRLYRTWDVSEQAPIALFRQVGCMPVWFDETAVLGDDTRFSTIIFRLAQGTNRMRADAYGGLTEGSADRWDTCLLSTGEARISITSALSGMQRRVLEIWAPLTNSPEIHENILENTRLAYGWPLRWLVRDPDVAWADDMHARIFGRLTAFSRSQQVEVSQAANIATCTTGFAVLCRLAGVDPVPWRTIVDAALELFRETLENAEERGSDIGERGILAIKAAMRQFPDRFPGPDEALHERWGVAWPDGVVGIMSESALRDILVRFGGADDPAPTIRKWLDTDRLVHEKDRRTGVRSIFVPGQGMVRTRMTLVKL